MGNFTGLRPIFDGKNHGFRLRFSQQNQSNEITGSGHVKNLDGLENSGIPRRDWPGFHWKNLIRLVPAGCENLGKQQFSRLNLPLVG